ncbi:MAG: AAA family ATPase [Candidatus Kapabacteria bacterium]|nr:AAA family ATPase [Candidatus Kapabacteria bacterium]
MFEIEKIIGRDKEIRSLRSAISEVKQSKRGSFFLVNGETGFGKSTFINFGAEHSSDLLNECKVASVDCTSPIGEFSLSNLQPLKPIAEALTSFSQKNSKMNAKTKFAIDVGMSLLSALPILGEVPYLIKTVSRDIKEYSENKSSESQKKDSSNEQKVLDQYVEQFKKLFEKVECPFVLIIDNAHWLDSFSCSFLEKMIPMLQKYPFLIVLAYRESELSKNLSFHQSIKQFKSLQSTSSVGMIPFGMEEISLLVSTAFPKSKNTNRLVEWILHNTQGVPSSVLEYIRYFTQHSPFTENGELIEDFEHSFQFPSSVKGATTKIVEQMTDEEVHILSIAAAEGIKFSILLTSYLMQTDPVSAIRKYRSIQRKYGVIRSIGIQNLYGTQTTCFEFTQTIYYTYFKNLLEKEENDVLHQAITSFLQQLFDSTDDEFIKASIAPYIAAHSIEYGDEVKVNEMIAKVAEVANDVFPASELMTTFQQSVEQALPENFSTENLETLFQMKELDFDSLLKSKDVSEQQELIQGEIKNLRESVTVLQKETEKVSKKVSTIPSQISYDYSEVRLQFLEALAVEEYHVLIDKFTQNSQEYSQWFSEEEMMFLTALYYRSLAEIGDVALAVQGITELLQSIPLEETDQTFILLKNIQLLIFHKNGSDQEVSHIIEQLLRLIQNAPNELRNISLANIEFVIS